MNVFLKEMVVIAQKFIFDTVKIDVKEYISGKSEVSRNRCVNIACVFR